MTTLPALLAGLDPQRRPGRYVYATVPVDAVVPAAAVATFVEDEGRTLVLPDRAANELGLAAEYPCTWITLRVNSQLAGIGLLARATAALAARGISVNPWSALHHDHLFVPFDRAEDAMVALRELPERASGTARAYRRSTGEMVGFARAVSDGVTFGYLADVRAVVGARGRAGGTSGSASPPPDHTCLIRPGAD